MRSRVFSATLCLLLAGCGHALEPRACTLIAVEALTVTVVDAATGQRICDATVTATDGAFSAELRPFALGPDCSYSGPTERPGRYDVRVTRSGYETAVRRDVTVTADECHVIPVRLGIDLDRSARP
jgi:carboxypeptidase family protein